MAIFMPFDLFPANSARCHRPAASTRLNDWSSPWYRCGQFSACNQSEMESFPTVLMPSMFDRTSSQLAELVLGKRQRSRYGASGGRRSPCRWTSTIDVYGFSPDDITVREVNGEVQIHAKHIEGEDDEEGGVLQREFKRSIKLPADIDPKSLRSIVSEDGNKLKLIAFRKSNKVTTDNSTAKINSDSSDIEIKTTKVSTEDNSSTQCLDTTAESQDAPLVDIGLEGFEPEHLKVRVMESDVFIHGEQNVVEDGMQVRRRFLRSFTLPQGVDTTTVTSTLTENGRLLIKAAPVPTIKDAEKTAAPVVDDVEQAVMSADEDIEPAAVASAVDDVI